jgi:tRNA G18 (ribose-2'-O)-methylase SpoU
VVPLDSFRWPARSVLVVGNEFHGLDEEWLALCDNFVTIPLAPNCDSLNVAVATGILLHHMRSASIETS